MPPKEFFDACNERSEVKAAVVSKYFWAWAKVVLPWAKKGPNKIAYIDLFAGPGYYDDGTKSTPLLILERAINDPDMRDMLVTVFNDINSQATQSLKQAIRSLPGVEGLRYAPQVHDFEVGSEIVRILQGMHLVPTLLFVDPWGYKGLSLDLIGSVLKNWGSDCIFFFNYNRINMGLGNERVREHMDALFSETKAEELRAVLGRLRPAERELTIVTALVEALQEVGGQYVLPFRFTDHRGTRTSHHLIFVSKHVRGYEIMKEIMAKESSRMVQGVPTLEYNPVDNRYPVLFEFTRPLDDLTEMLLSKFAGQKLLMRQIYEKHQVGTPYIKRNYKYVLMQLEREGRIIADPPAEHRRQNTFADQVQVVFPKR
jgi:three-Cys-motif partner protein